MNKDMCVACDDGILNIRVGAIIMKDGKILMVGNDRDYLYSVGGRVKFGETAEEAVVREVLEETGVQMEIDRLGFVHENYFYGDVPSNRNKLIYEISLFFYMKVPDAFAPISESFMEDNSKEHLVWASLDEDIKMYPEFFKTELKNPTDTVKFFTTDKRSINRDRIACRVRKPCGCARNGWRRLRNELESLTVCSSAFMRTMLPESWMMNASP